MLSWLDPSQLVYCDTDSVIFAYDPNNENHKYPCNKAPGIPANVRFGDALGEWENEFSEDEWIIEIVVGGAKSYSYVTNKGKIVIKQKGITLDRCNSNIFTFENVKNIVLNNLPLDEEGEPDKLFKVNEVTNKLSLESEKIYQFTWNPKTKDIETRYVSRSVQSTIDSKRTILSNFDTLPFGYEK